MDFIADSSSALHEPSIHFWTPCHATPYYSFLHRNVSMWFPDCSPINRERPEGCESHQLERDPVNFLSRKYRLPTSANVDSTGVEPLPDFVVLFSTTHDRLSRLLRSVGYVEAATFFHSHVKGDAEDTEASSAMLVFRRKRSVDVME
ncbi:hypothetical protein PINS_up000459 [Pythium insidiosum]|nr:hypothetical protein PINS_up000459 [Pythium insidiosum]